eukprot:353755-Chlamydomonas_euryale.AAC.2
MVVHAMRDVAAVGRDAVGLLQAVHVVQPARVRVRRGRRHSGVVLRRLCHRDVVQDDLPSAVQIARGVDIHIACVHGEILEPLHRKLGACGSQLHRGEVHARHRPLHQHVARVDARLQQQAAHHVVVHAVADVGAVLGDARGRREAVVVVQPALKRHLRGTRTTQEAYTVSCHAHMPCCCFCPFRHGGAECDPSRKWLWP